MQDAVEAEPQDAVPVQEQLIATCEAGSRGTRQWLVGVGLATAVTLYQIIRYLLTDHPLRATVWVVVLCYGVPRFYTAGWRRPDRIELTRTTLRWVAPFRRVEVPLRSVREVHTAFRRNKGRKIVVDGEGTRTVNLSLRDLDDMDPFLATLLTAAPGIEVHVSPLSVQRRI